jgi:MFS family permease
LLNELFGIRKIAILGACLSTLSILLSAFIQKMQLYFLSYSIGFGIGQALLLTSTLAILPHYFNKRLSLATGLMSFIGAILVVFIPIITDLIIKKHGLSATFFFLAGLNCITIFMVFTYRPVLRSAHKKSKLETIKQSFGFEILKKRRFIIWCIASFIGMLGYLIPIVNIVS